MNWLDRLLAPNTRSLGELPPDLPELQNSHGGSFVSGIVNGLGSLVTYPRDAYEGTIDPRSEAGIERAFDAAGSMGLSARSVARAAPEGALGVFAGRKAATANLDNLAAAEKMVSAGADPAHVWDKTGWFQGGDGNWRFEIDDSAARIAQPARDSLNATRQFEGKLPDALSHPDLYEAYPSTANVNADVYHGQLNRGSYSPGIVDEKPYFSSPGQISATGRDPDAMRSTLLHEAQHDIQAQEGFAKGSNQNGLKPGTPAWDIYQERLRAITTPPTLEEFARQAGYESLDAARPDYAAHVQRIADMARKGVPRDIDVMAQRTGMEEGYRRAGGEVEARNVQTRRDMTPEQRRAAPPWTTEDVPRDQQWFRF